jgi:CubicO group peptidase (beta-lactamase class C family)
MSRRGRDSTAEEADPTSAYPHHPPMRPSRAAVGLWWLVSLIGCSPDSPPEGDYFPEREVWERRRPEELGLDSALVRQAVAAAAEAPSDAPRDLAAAHATTFGLEPHGEAIGPLGTRGEQTGLIVYRGYIVAEWGEPERADQAFSVAKSVLSSVVGLAVDRGLISNLHSPVAASMTPIALVNGGYGPAAPPGRGNAAREVLDLFAGEHNSTITWDHLLRQTSDWEGTLWGKPDWADRPSRDTAQWLTRPRNDPGTVFEYNDVRVNVLALAALNAWKRPLPEVAKEHLFDPIGASDTWRWIGYDNSWVLIDGQAVQSVSGGSHWGGGLFINTFDLARFGLLTLHRGKWKEEQLLSEEWIDLALTPTAASMEPYGFMNWYLDPSLGTFTHQGAGPNIVHVDPRNELVIVTRWTLNIYPVIDTMIRAMGKDPYTPEKATADRSAEGHAPGRYTSGGS